MKQEKPIPLYKRLENIKDRIVTANVMWVEAEKLKQNLEANSRMMAAVDLLSQEIVIAKQNEVESE